MIREDHGSELIPCYVTEILTGDPKRELGIRVSCEGGKIGRVTHIGTESAYKTPIDLVTVLERRIRKLIVDVMSHRAPDWWDNCIPCLVRRAVEEKQRRRVKRRKELKIPEYTRIEETDFSHLYLIIGYKKNWNSCFEPIFKEKHQTMKKMEDLASYRNLPAHSKDLTEDIERTIRDYFDDLILLIENHYRKNNRLYA